MAAAPDPGSPLAHQPSKMYLRWVKLKEMWLETRENHDYALYMGLKIDL